ncbi:MAG: hypothetical protein FWE64_00630 [Alphaproteobacteria bacterium]|nr:hypothetical protein [Alphaproteobacteria bacterium]
MSADYQTKYEYHIKYKIDKSCNKYGCITRCPHGEEREAYAGIKIPIMVGSAHCIQCGSFLDMSITSQAVICAKGNVKS